MDFKHENRCVLLLIIFQKPCFVDALNGCLNMLETSIFSLNFVSGTSNAVPLTCLGLFSVVVGYLLL